MPTLTSLPIDSSLGSLGERIRQGSGRLILESPAGSGKSTRLAPALLKSFTGKIFLLQPRRSSTLLLAHRIAEENDWSLGREVGYLMRLEKKFARDTRLIVATHGSFLQYLSSHPELEGIDAVLVDEFHERSLDIDLLTGLLRYSQRELREDLRLVWMSATGGAEDYAKRLDAELVRLEGRTFPIEFKYQAPAKKTLDPLESLNGEAVKAFREIQKKNPQARILCFLPGQREILNLERLITADSALKSFSILKLHGSLDLSEQERVIKSATPAQIILSTNIAETSLTLRDISFVVDLGYQKLLSFDAASGREFLQLEMISADAAVQRAGRCGRTGPGTCYRLWSEDQQRFREPQQKPEILRRSLEGAILRLIDAGFANFREFPWITPPPAGIPERIVDRFEKMNLLEKSSGAIEGYVLSEIGRGVFRWPVDVRWGFFLEKAARSLAANFPLAAALATISDPAQRQSLKDELFQKFRDQLQRSPASWMMSERELFQDLCERGGAKPSLGGWELSKNLESELRQLVLECFPDFLCKRRGKNVNSALLGSGRGLEWDGLGPVGDYFLALDVALRPFSTDSRLLAWMDVSRDEVERLSRRFAQEDVWLDDSDGKHRFFRQKKIFGLGISEPEMVRPSPVDEQKILQDLFQGKWAEFLEANSSFSEIHRRLRLALPDRAPLVSAQFCEIYAASAGRKSLDPAFLKDFDFYSILSALLSPAEVRDLDRWTPRTLKLANGRQRSFEYLADGSVDVSVMLQDLLGVRVHPTVGREARPVRIHLLSPAKRPIQVTSNLPGFWKTSYAEVRKELRGRYPKHKWPEDPLA